MKNHNRQRAERARFNAVVLLAEKKCSQIYLSEKHEYLFYVQHKLCKSVRDGKIPAKIALNIMNDHEAWEKYVSIVKREYLERKESEAKERENKSTQILLKNTHWKSVYTAGIIVAVLALPFNDVYQTAKASFMKRWGTKQEAVQKEAANENSSGTVNNFFYFHNECIPPRLREPKLPVPTPKDHDPKRAVL